MKTFVRTITSVMLGLCVVGFIFVVTFFFGTGSFMTSLRYELDESGSESYYVVTGVKFQASTHIKIPAEHKGLPVKGIGGSAFNACYGLKTLTIPASVTKIGDTAYANTSLKKINYQGSLEEWFKMDIGAQGTKVVGNARNFTLYIDGKAVTDLVIPDTVKTIKKNAFANCGAITSITFHSNVKSIGVNAFRNCQGLTEIALPKGLTALGSEAFAECEGIKKLHVEMEVGGDVIDKAFSKCYYMETVTTNADNAAYAEENDVLYTKDKTEIAYIPMNYQGIVVLPDTVVAVKVDAFNGRASVTGVVFPEGMKTVRSTAFAGCTKLTRVYFKQSGKISVEEREMYYNSATKMIVTDAEYAALSSTEQSLCAKMKVLAFTVEGSENEIYVIDSSNDNIAMRKIVDEKGEKRVPTPEKWYYYSETAPTTSGAQAWHFVDGIPTEWPIPA